MKWADVMKPSGRGPTALDPGTLPKQREREVPSVFPIFPPAVGGSIKQKSYCETTPTVIGSLRGPCAAAETKYEVDCYDPYRPQLHILFQIYQRSIGLFQMVQMFLGNMRIVTSEQNCSNGRNTWAPFYAVRWAPFYADIQFIQQQRETEREGTNNHKYAFTPSTMTNGLFLDLLGPAALLVEEEDCCCWLVEKEAGRRRRLGGLPMRGRAAVEVEEE
jgi:hypothetical protein